MTWAEIYAGHFDKIQAVYFEFFRFLTITFSRMLRFFSNFIDLETRSEYILIETQSNENFSPTLPLIGCCFLSALDHLTELGLSKDLV